MKAYSFSSADHSEFQTRYMQLLKGMHKNDPDLEKIMKPEIYSKVIESLSKLRKMGYRTKLINQSENVLE